MFTGRTLRLVVPVVIGAVLGFALHRSPRDSAAPEPPGHAGQSEDVGAEAAPGPSQGVPPLLRGARAPVGVPRAADPIAGTVTSRDGEPLAGVEVQLRPDPLERWPRMGESLEARLQWMIDDDTWRRARSITVHSDAAGKYQTGNLASDAVYSGALAPRGGRSSVKADTVCRPVRR